jgi:hypothetical protein
MVVTSEGGSRRTEPSKDILYIASFLGSVILLNWLAGTKATYYYLLLVLAGVAVVNVGRYNISITTPDIMQN